MILVMLTGFTYSQNYKLGFSNEKLYQESNNKWLVVNIDTLTTKLGHYRLITSTGSCSLKNSTSSE